MFSNLEIINLSDTDLEQKGFQFLFDSHFLGNLEVLLIANNKVNLIPTKVEKS